MKKPFFSVLAFVVLASCASKKDDAPSCDDHAKLDGVCPGVTSASVGTEGVACTTQVSVGNSDELTAKAASATAGTCLVLSEGNYVAVTLPAGVSLLGKGASSTSVDGVVLTGGSAATIRGITVHAGGIVATGAGSVTIDRVSVSDAAKIGISATDTSLTILSSTVERSTKWGIMAGSSCTTSCAGTTPKLVLRGVLLRDNHAVGVWAHGVDVEITGMQIESTRADGFLYGRGLEVAAEPNQSCSVKATSFAVTKSDEVGVLVDGCAADLSSFLASSNIRGVQLQGVPDGAGNVHDFSIEGNSALGLGIIESKGIIVQGGRIAGTTSMKVPVDIGGVQEVGDGLNWLKSDVAVGNAVRIENSARRGVIIDDTSTGKFEGTLGGGDETKGIIVQGGLTASVQDGLSIGSGVKTDVLTKDMAVPVAARVVKKKKD